MAKLVTIHNPWLRINWKNTIASCDIGSSWIKKHAGQLQLSTLPEPFTGNPNSKVYCLNLNPGAKDAFFESFPANKKKLLGSTQRTLNHTMPDNMWFSLYEHEGYCWWRRITKEIRTTLGRNPNMFVIEYFPYHSVKSISFPKKLPSYAYSDQLIQNAMNEGKYILILRHKKEWFDRIHGLRIYNKLFYIINPQNPYITASNIRYIHGTSSGVSGLLKSF